MNSDMRDVLQVAFRIMLDRIEDLAEEAVQAKAETVEAEERVEALEERVVLLTAGPEAAEQAERDADRIIRGAAGEPVAHRQVLEELRLPDTRFEARACPPCSACGEPIRVDGRCGCTEPASLGQAAIELVAGLAGDDEDPTEEVAHLEHSLKQTTRRLVDTEAQLAASQQRCRELESRLVKGGCGCRPDVTVSRMPCPECSSPMTYREPGGWSCDACEQLLGADCGEAAEDAEPAEAVAP